MCDDSRSNIRSINSSLCLHTIKTFTAIFATLINTRATPLYKFKLSLAAARLSKESQQFRLTKSTASNKYPLEQVSSLKQNEAYVNPWIGNYNKLREAYMKHIEKSVRGRTVFLNGRSSTEATIAQQQD